MTTLAVIGAGAVGATVAYAATLKNLCSEILLIDRDEDKEAGEVMDIADGLSVVETGMVRRADYKDARRADIIVVAAGAAQKPGETRLDLVEKNTAIQREIFKRIGKLKKTAIVIVIANPVDVLTHVIQELTGLPHGQVFGTGTTLDSARLKTELARTLDVSPHDVQGFVLGEHGDSEFVAWSTVTVGGVAAKEIKALTAQKKKAIEKRVRTEAYRIIACKGATHFGIASITADILEAIVFDQKRVLPVTTHLTRWNNVSNVCLGAPAVIGRGGAERHWPLRLSSDECRALKHSAKTVQQFLT